ncbi:MAG: DUF1571 domain-containing protein [Gemmataceae bacterium]
MTNRTAAWMVLLTATSTVCAWPEVPLVPVPPLPLPLAKAAPAKSSAAAAAAPGLPGSSTSAATTSKASPAALDNPSSGPSTNPARIERPEELLRLAREQLRTFDSYIVRLSRREAINGQMQPEEVMMFRFRAKPWSVYLKWLSKEGKGREVVYVKGQHDNKIHSLLSAGDIPFMPAGKRMALSPDNILVKNACRHPLEEAGLAASVERLGRILSQTRDDPKRYGRVKLIGPVKRNEFEQPVWGLEHTLPPGADPTLERGGKRTYYFDPDTHLPMLITAFDERGEEVEYYFYDRLQRAVKLDDYDFDPDHLWGRSL